MRLVELVGGPLDGRRTSYVGTRFLAATPWNAKRCSEYVREDRPDGPDIFRFKRYLSGDEIREAVEAGAQRIGF